MKFSDVSKPKGLHKLCILLTTMIVLWAGSCFAQLTPSVHSALSELSKTSSEKMDVVFDERLGTISFLKGSFEPAVPGKLEESAFRFLEANGNAFQIRAPRSEFSVLLVRSDSSLRTQHVYLEQKIKGVPIWGHRLGFHYDQKGKIYAVSGKYSSTRDLLPEPTLSGSRAIQLAMEELERVLDREPTDLKLAVPRDNKNKIVVFDIFFPPAAELVFYPDVQGELNLAWLVRLSVASPQGAWLIFVDAHQGGILFLYNNIQSAGPAVGSGIDLWGNTIPLNTYLDTDGKYKLIDTTKYMFTHHTSTHPHTTWQGAIEIRDCGHAVDAQEEPVTSSSNPVIFDPNNDNVFDDAGEPDEKKNYRAAVSLATYFSQTYDFYLSTFNRNSIDNHGWPVIANVHLGNEYPNAFWNPQYKMMFFGDNVAGEPPFAKADDVVAHEFTHGVTNFEVPPDGLVYINQSGALNDSYSDLFAVTLDYGDWWQGEDLIASPSSQFRRLDDPTLSNPPQPKDMFNFFLLPFGVDNGGVHINNGIPNHLFYLLSTSLPPQAPASDGRYTAIKIVYRAYVYLASNPTASFRDWGVYMKQAAIDLFGSGSVYDAVVSALNAVHIPQALVLSYDNGFTFDQSGELIVFVFADALPCVSVRFTKPESGAKLKTIGVDFFEFPNSVISCNYKIYVCGSNPNGSPNDSSCPNPTFTIPHSQVKKDGYFTQFNLDPAGYVATDFHVKVCYEPTGLSWDPSMLLADNGQPGTERSWVYYFDVNTQSFKWSTIKSLPPPFPDSDSNLLIRTIMEIPTLEIPSIGVTSPNGGENWAAGSRHDITWTSSNLNPAGGIYIFYWFNNDWQEITGPLLTSSTSYSWTVPNTTTTSAWIYVGNWVNNAWEVSDQSDNAFTISELFAWLVTAYYQDILGREPDQGGLDFWTSEINRMQALGIDIKEGFIALGKEFFKSEEYIGMGKNDSAYIRDLYLTFLQREPDQGGWDFWVGYLTNGASRDLVMNYFVFSPEFRTYMEGAFGVSTARPENSLVNDFYRGLLGRLPDDSGFNYWLGQMRAAQCAGNEQQIRDLSYQLALLFIQSQEYANRGRDNKGYIEDLYDAIMRRSADPVSEIGYWVSMLNTMTRAQVLQLFTNSAEYQNRVTEVINAGCAQQ